MERTIEDLFGAEVAKKSSFLKPPTKQVVEKENDSNSRASENSVRSLFPQKAPKIMAPIAQIDNYKPAFIIKPAPPISKVKIDPSKTQISLESWFIIEDTKIQQLFAVGHRHDINEVSQPIRVVNFFYLIDVDE